MGFLVGSADQKQHLNLSEEAWYKIDNDRENFSSSSEPIPLATFLNQVIENFYQNSEASISIQSKKLKEKLMDSYEGSKLRKKYNSQTALDFVEHIVSMRRVQIVDRIEAYEKGEGRKFRLSNENVEILESLREDPSYEGNLGKYLKALFEEYASKGYSERELIYFSSIKEAIEDAIRARVGIKITLNNGEKRHLLPYGIFVEKMGTFHYLIGYETYDKNGEKRYSPVTFRISRIESVKKMLSVSARIPKSLTDGLDANIHDLGPQFLAGEAKEIVVRLSTSGEKKLRSIIRNKPILKSKEGQNYTFLGSETQAYIYFHRFGEDATILSPEKLRKKMEKSLKATLRNYEETKTNN